jgi:hypothetical protein
MARLQFANRKVQRKIDKIAGSMMIGAGVVLLSKT